MQATSHDTGTDRLAASGSDQKQITGEDVRAALDAVVRSETFARADRARALLIYLVESEQNGSANRLKGFTIGQDVFGKDDDFDPATDAVVRVQAGRLRDQLASFYREEGAGQPIEIAVPKGTYVPRYRWRAASASGTGAASAGTPSIRPVDFGNSSGGFQLDNASAKDAVSVSAKLNGPDRKSGHDEALTPFIVRNVKRFWFALAAILLLLWVILFLVWS